MERWWWTVALLLGSFCIADSFRILAFLPFPMTSHQNVFAPILHELARRGHQVVYLTPVKPKLTHPNLEVRLIPEFKNEFIRDLDLKQFRSAPKAMFSHVMASTSEKYSREMYGNEAAQKIIHGSEAFDACILEAQFAQESTSALLHKFGCVGIEIAPMHDMAWLNELSGLPDNPSYQVDFKSDYTEQMPGLLERAHNTLVTWSVIATCYYHMYKQRAIMDEYFNYPGWESRPSIYQLTSNRSLVIVNQEPALSYPFPKAPHMKPIGGPNIIPGPPKPLPQDLQDFLDRAKEGVIYFALGSNLQTSEISSGEVGRAFMSAFRDLPHKILMKWESDEKNLDFPPNVKTYKWLPQQELLGHKNILMFISHGGYLSLTESVYHGVPILGIPFFADQPKNVRQVESFGLGLRLEYDNITKESVTWGIREILTNPRYREEAQRRRSMMRGKGQTGIDEAAYWIEYATRYPNAMTPRSAFLNFFQVHMIDVYLLYGASLFLVLALLRDAFRFLIPKKERGGKKLKQK